MITIKHLQHIFLVAFFALALKQAHAQTIDENTYEHKIRLMDSLSLYKMQDYDTLCRVSISGSFRGYHYTEVYYGWILKRTPRQMRLLTINGKEVGVNKKDTAKVTPLPLNQETIDSVASQDKNMTAVFRGNFAKNYNTLVWLYEKNQTAYSKQLFTEHRRFFADSNIRNDFGYLYYDAMLQAYSYERDYLKAITFGQHLSAGIFKGFQYQKEAIALTRQLENNVGDFKTFRLPDSVGWSALKQKFTRAQQIHYLADRLRLLNCIQSGQPADISYNMYQYSVPFFGSDFNYWSPNQSYGVINPFIELMKIKLTLPEVELLLPYLLTDTFIPSYNYHRDFFVERNLHRLSWVVEDLIYKATNRLFLNRLAFDNLTVEEKKIEIEKIRSWCEENSGLSSTALTISTLKTAIKWADFYAALQTAREQEPDSLVSIIAKRFYDFDKSRRSTSQRVMSQTMFELGDKKYISVVKKWSTDTVNKWVSLWSSMYLIKNDIGSYKSAMQQLKAILQQCDGTYYYPHAMNLLLNLNDPAAFKLAEGIVDKPGFQRMMNWGYYFNFIKNLLLLKSDHTFNFLNSKLESYTPDEMARSHKDNDHMMIEDDTYVLVVDELKNGKEGYPENETNSARQEYINTLKEWFKMQYKLLKEGKPNQMRLEITPEQEPVTTIDSYRQ